MDRKLQLQAELRNNVSPKLKQIAKDMQDVRQTPGMDQVGKWFSSFNETAEGFTKGGASVAGIFSAMGVGGLAAAGSIAELAKSFKDLGDHTFALKRLSGETGLTMTQIARWEYVGQSFRVSTEEMEGALKTLGDQMVDFRRRRGDLFGQLNEIDPKFTQKLGLEDADHQLQDIFEWLGKITDPSLRDRWAKAFGGEALAQIVSEGLPRYHQAVQDAARGVSPITEELLKQSDAFNTSLVRFDQTWENFKTEIGPAVFDQLKLALDDFRGVFEGIKATWDWLVKAKNDPGAAANQVVEAVGQAASDKAHEMGQRWQGRAKAVEDAWAAATAGNSDGNALRRNDETVAQPSASGDEKPSLWGRLFHRSADIQWDDDQPDQQGQQGQSGTGGGLTDALSAVLGEGVKEGVLAAFREWSQQQQLDGGGGLMNASYETGGTGGGAGRGGGGGAGGAGGGGLTASSSILDMIRKGESGTTGPDGYGVVTGQWKGARPDLQHMSINDVLAFQEKMLRSGVTDSAVGAYQINHVTLSDFKQKLGLSGSETFDAAMQDRLAREIFKSTGGSIASLRGRWTSLNNQSSEAIRAAIGNGTGVNLGDPSSPGGVSSPGHIGGQLKIGDESFRFGSGGQGNNSIPYGDYPITPNTIGAWGASHDAIGVNNNAIYDQALKRMRTGIEMHAGHSAELFTEGCVAFEAQQWPHVKSEILGMIKKEGHAYLHVGPHGASVTSSPTPPDVMEEARKANAARRNAGGDPSDGSIEAHIHLHQDGRVRGATASGSGVVAQPQLHLRRAPTMTEPSTEA